jgi:DNA-binding MarR family transcriptional regulator
MVKNIINYGEVNSLNLKLTIILSKATKEIHRRSSKIFNEGGLTTAQFAVLEALYHKGNLTINQIIDSVLSTGGNMTVVINNLEKSSLIQRIPNMQDKRSFLIKITDKGSNYINSIFPKHLDDLEHCFTDLTNEEKMQLINLLKKVKSDQ